MMETSSQLPKAVFWFRVYAGCMAGLYGLVFLVGAACLIWGISSAPPADKPLFLVMGAMYGSIGFLFGVAYSLAFSFKPTPFAWVYHLVLICIGFGGCPTIAASIPLLIYWIKPEIRRYYGKQ